jgi:hypothetical protein
MNALTRACRSWQRSFIPGAMASGGPVHPEGPRTVLDVRLAMAVDIGNQPHMRIRSSSLAAGAQMSYNVPASMKCNCIPDDLAADES